MRNMASPNSTDMTDFLRPLAIDTDLVLRLAKELTSTFRQLSDESETQFLPTPISESILRPVAGKERGRFLAIDIGGTNLRVGFVELLGDSAPSEKTDAQSSHENGVDGKDHKDVARLRLVLEQTWSIGDHLKNEEAESLFKWIGGNIAAVVREGVAAFGLPTDVELPMGVTFSFPMAQSSLSQATLMSMGKGFAITSKLDLGEHLMTGYQSHWKPDIPRIKIAAILNDSVATLVSHIYQFPADANQKAVMGLIVGTGCNATIPMKLSCLHVDKRPKSISVLPGQEKDDVRIAVNTEWSISGSAKPLRDLGLISAWDKELDDAGEMPGFQPLEYMTAGRYLGELARIVFLDYMETVLQVHPTWIPKKLRQKSGLTTTFISLFYPGSQKHPMLRLLQDEFHDEDEVDFGWTQDHADALHNIAKAIELRAAGIIAAATLALLVCAEELPAWDSSSSEVIKEGTRRELVVGWTGGCIQHFQNYLEDCQMFLDESLSLNSERGSPIRVTLSPCHDGGIKGAGILVPAALASRGALNMEVE